MGRASHRPGAVRRHLPLLFWALAVALMALILLWRFQPAYTLDSFLPAPRTVGEKILVERTGQGPGASWVLLALAGEPERAARVRQTLLQSGRFRRVDDGSGMVSVDQLPAPVWHKRYLLQDQDWSTAALQTAMTERLADLGLGGGAEWRDMIRADPALVALSVMSSVASPTAPATVPWRSPDGRSLLLAETHAGAFDVNGQQAALATIHEALEQYPPPLSSKGPGDVISGAGMFSAELSATIRSEATWRSIFAGLGVLLVLWLAYRRPRYLLLAALPLGLGVLGAVTAVSLVFGQVHGITLAFGFTLLGVAVDYPLHLLSHARGDDGRRALRRVWPTLWLGGVSTLAAYATLMVADSEGLAQLGLFAAAGILTALLATRTLLPAYLPARTDTGSPTEAPGGWPRWWPASLALLIGGGVLLLSPTLWNTSLAALSPVPADRLQQDAVLREALGAPDMRYLLAWRDADQEPLRRRLEALAPGLDEAVAAGELAGYQLPTTLLPSRARQQQRRDAVPGAVLLRQRVANASEELPFRPDSFEPFIDDATAISGLAPVQAGDYQGTPLATWLDALYYRSGDDWVGLASLFDLQQPDALASRLAGGPAHWVDMKQSADGLVARYRGRITGLLGLAALAVIGFLVWRVRQPSRVAWIALTVLAGTAVAAGTALLVDGSLNLFHLIALILVAGLGLDYALFLSREDGGGRDTRHAVSACVASTTVAFGVLALSSIPMLHWLGLTVSSGALACYTLAWLGRRRIIPDTAA